jgi:hypothetical protein
MQEAKLLDEFTAAAREKAKLIDEYSRLKGINEISAEPRVYE